jgi:DNA-directed RNA polymerase I subunit RPA1
MWTGKQVISTVILNILPADMPPLTLFGGRAKVGVKNWQVAGHREPAEDMSESTVVIRYEVLCVCVRLLRFRRGQLLCGVFDKAQFGAASFSLVHCAHELYGSRIACDLLSAFSRLFTTFLQVSMCLFPTPSTRHTDARLYTRR